MHYYSYLKILQQQLMIHILVIAVLVAIAQSISIDNVCTFHVGGKLFSLVYLQNKNPYTIPLNQNKTIQYNFCKPFTPEGCSDDNLAEAYSFQITKVEPILDEDEDKYDPNIQNASLIQQFQDETQDEQTQPAQQTYFTRCIRYSSDAYSRYFAHSYNKDIGKGKLILNLKPNHSSGKFSSERHTIFQINCSDYQGFSLEGFSINNSTLRIQGNSKYGCPVFQVSSLWSVIQDNWVIFGIILFIIGFQSLFFGRITIEITIFMAAFFICLGIFGAILTVFIGPQSSTFTVYLSFIILLAISTLISYGITRLVDISIFFVGAWLGFILALLVNSIFCKMFDIYSVWSLVIFAIVFAIPFGLLTFKYRNQIIIISTSLTGAYLMIRPISWIFGGFPNQLLLYHMKETNTLDTLPWVFFLYLILIVVLAVVGGMYQFLKLSRQSEGEQIEINFIQQNIEGPLDRVKQKIVDGIIQKYKSDEDKNDQYEKMREMNQKKSVDEF